MAEEKRVVIPDDMGKTIAFGATETDKWNVKHDNTLLTKADGSLSVVPPGYNRITNLNTMAGLPSGDGTFCIYGFHNGNDKIPGIMANANATSETQPRWESGETTADYDWNGWVTRAGNQMTVYINHGSATWSSVNDDASAAPAGWSEWRRVENVAPPKTSGGLDCNTISALPQKPWKKGTSVLGQQDGNCVRLVPTENLFQEIGVALSANKLSGEVGDTYHVVATVTNSGESTNEVTDLTINKPALGNYTVSNFRTNTSAGASIERVSDYAYKVKKLATGSTAKVEFDVVANAGGTFQFGAAVNPNTAFDLQSNNNQATITLSARVLTDQSYTPTVDCPAITVRDKTHNKVLMMGGTATVDDVSGNAGRNNIYTARPRTITLTTDVDIQILATRSTTRRAYGHIADETGASIAVDGDFEPGVSRDRGEIASSVEDSIARLVSPREIEVTVGDMFIIYVYMKPKSTQNCKWQWVRLCIEEHPPVPGRTLVPQASYGSAAVITNTVDGVNSRPVDPATYQVIDRNKTYPIGASAGSNPSGLRISTNKIVFTAPGTYRFTGRISDGTYSVGKFGISTANNVTTVVVAQGLTQADNVSITVGGIRFITKL